MQTQFSTAPEPMALDVSIDEPYATETMSGQVVHGPDITVRPLGLAATGPRIMLTFSVAEARELAATLTQRCDEAEALFGKGGRAHE